MTSWLVGNLLNRDRMYVSMFFVKVGDSDGARMFGDSGDDSGVFSCWRVAIEESNA